MRSGCKSLTRPSGFTLLEVIVTLIVASILGVIFLEFMGTTVQKSYEPIKMIQGSLDVSEVIEASHNAGLAFKVAKLVPLACIKG